MIGIVSWCHSKMLNRRHGVEARACAPRSCLDGFPVDILENHAKLRTASCD
jgi:hypothetical protein